MIAWFLTTKLGRWLGGIGAFLLAILSAWLYGREGGKHEQEKKDAVANQEANQQAQAQTQKAQEDRVHVDSEVQKLPDIGPQPVENADPATAAGKLRDWMRP